MARTAPILLALFALAACDDSEGGAEARPTAIEDAPEPRPSAPAPDGRTVVWVGGDILPAAAIRRSVRAGGDSAAGFAALLEPAAAVWRRDGRDAFVVVNLETPVAREHRVANDTFTRVKVGNRLVRAPLNGEPWMLEGLRRADVDAVMLANNHTLDQERAGLAETMDAAHAAGLVTTGAGLAPHTSWPIVVGPEGARAAVLTFFEKDFPEPELAEGEPGLSVLSDDSPELVRAAAADSDGVVVIIHVVAELWSGVKDRWRDLAERFADAGADAIAFHGTHVPGPVETIVREGRRVTVAYQLGNMVSDMGTTANPTLDPPPPDDLRRWESPETREGLLMRVEVRPDGVESTFVPIWMHQDRWLINNRVHDGAIRFALLPLAACGPATAALADWPEPWQTGMRDYIGERRDHLLSVAGLQPRDCRPGEVTPIPSP
jgi:poly-gamma-glutamate synthesis protein (capsule biosynthesis protein)